MLNFDVAGKRILEVGCGTALTSLLLNKQLQDITATDYHPDAEGMLQRNAALNGDREIPFERIGWADDGSKLGLFDLIVGSDILYEQDNVQLLAEFIEAHAQPACEVVIVDPSRGQAGRFSRQMKTYGFGCSERPLTPDEQIGEPFTGRILQYQRA
jgi:ETFB lysine methyltransferase